MTAGFPISIENAGQSGPHIPPQQEDAPQENGSDDPPLLPLLTTGFAISEIFRPTFRLPHFGHESPSSRFVDGISASKSLLQSRQIYSYNGIEHLARMHLLDCRRTPKIGCYSYTLYRQETSRVELIDGIRSLTN